MMGAPTVLRRLAIACASACSLLPGAFAGDRQPVVPPGMHVEQQAGVLMLVLDGMAAPRIAPQPAVDVVAGPLGPVLVLRGQAAPAAATGPVPAEIEHPGGARELRLPDVR